MLQDSLKAWKEIKKEERLLDYDPADKNDEIKRSESSYPKDGLVLKSFCRDLERKGLDKNDWRTSAWNWDFVWFNKSEMENLIPAKLAKDTEWDMPAKLVRRVYRIYFRDNVRGQTNPFPDGAIETATLKAKVKKLRRKGIEIDLSGAVKIVDGERGVEGKLLGKIVYDPNKKKFTKFELVMAGERWGRTAYNARQDDTERAPVGYAMRMTGDDSIDRVAPSHFSAYGWK
ncbi:MAG: hypothetical protein ACYTDT_01215 [Planctomycetota bacterium]|jgi:hypothetical protein